MKRAELYREMKKWTLGEVILMSIYVLIELPIEKIIDACFSHATDEIINGALHKIGRAERITQ